ncbi:MAG: hypothetical protein ACI9TA_000881 [Reinekea sp.]
MVLAIDVSSSVDASEDRLQRAGLASALLDPDVEAAFFISADPVALYVFEWSGRYNQQILVDWTIIDTPNVLFDVAQDIAASTRLHDDFPTAMGYALGYAATELNRGPSCLTQTIDIAGDGVNNDGFGPIEAYSAFPFDGVTVNGLVVNAADFEGETDLIPFFKNQVIRGPAAFVEIANGFDEYAIAMRRKLLRELTSMIMGSSSQIHPPKG